MVTLAEMVRCWEASGTECVTVALRRVDLKHEREKRNLLDVIDRGRFTILPNTAGCYNAEDALRTAGRSPTEEGFTNSEVLRDPNLLFLGDVLPLPSWMPFANVFSIGDVLIAVGIFWCVHAICRGRGVANEPSTV